MYFLFVVLLCAVSLAASVAVMYVHGRSSGIEASLAMPEWVSRPIFTVRRSALHGLCDRNSVRPSVCLSVTVGQLVYLMFRVS